MNENRAGPVFDALSDPMRRRLLARLSTQPLTATELAAALPISRQAVSKHLTSLTQAGLLEQARAGRHVRHHVTPEPLDDAVTWMTEVRENRDARLSGLGRLTDPTGDGQAAADADSASLE